MTLSVRLTDDDKYREHSAKRERDNRRRCANVFLSYVVSRKFPLKKTDSRRTIQYRLRADRVFATARPITRALFVPTVGRGGKRSSTSLDTIRKCFSGNLGHRRGIIPREFAYVAVTRF